MKLEEILSMVYILDELNVNPEVNISLQVFL